MTDGLGPIYKQGNKNTNNVAFVYLISYSVIMNSLPSYLMKNVEIFLIFFTFFL